MTERPRPLLSPQSELDSKRAPKKIDFDILESLRGLAALYVCIAHSRGVLWIGGEIFLKQHPRSTWSLATYAMMGLNLLTRLSTEFVIFFFVLSGFSIAHSLRQTVQVSQFFKRRFVRLYPPFFAAFLWALVIIGVLYWQFPHFFDGSLDTLVFQRLRTSLEQLTPAGVICTLLYLQADGITRPFWSLAHEVIFYCLAPAIMVNKKAYYVLSILLFVSSVAGFQAGILPHSIPADFCYYNFFFALGIYYYGHHQRTAHRMSLSFFKMVALAAGLFLTMVGVSLLRETALVLALNAVIAALLSLVLMSYFLRNEVRLPWLISLGKFSYTLYSTHFSTIFLYLGLYYKITGSSSPYIADNAVWLPCVPFCILVAYLHYRLVEKQCKDWLARSRQREGK